MSKLTEYARGQPCLIRYPGHCSFNNEETVACHVPLMGYHGTGHKIGDIFIAFGCRNCHSIADRREHLELDQYWVRSGLLEGMIRTQAHILKNAPHLIINYAKRSA